MKGERTPIEFLTDQSSRVARPLQQDSDVEVDVIDRRVRLFEQLDVVEANVPSESIEREDGRETGDAGTAIVEVRIESTPQFGCFFAVTASTFR